MPGKVETRIPQRGVPSFEYIVRLREIRLPGHRSQTGFDSPIDPVLAQVVPGRCGG